MISTVIAYYISKKGITGYMVSAVIVYYISKKGERERKREREFAFS
jgi:hypothetical protein